MKEHLFALNETVEYQPFDVGEFVHGRIMAINEVGQYCVWPLNRKDLSPMWVFEKHIRKNQTQVEET